LWHFDFHEGKRKVLTAAGERKTPYLFGLLDDCSRVCCHAQWYLERENTADLVHGLSQGIQKRGGCSSHFTQVEQFRRLMKRPGNPVGGCLVRKIRLKSGRSAPTPMQSGNCTH